MMELAAHDHYQIGRRFVSESYLLDAEQIMSYGRQFDPQPFHVDEEAAKRSQFGGLIASGWHTAALTMRLLVGSGAFMAGGAVGAGADIKWLRPAHAGDMLTVTTEVAAVMLSLTKPDRCAVTLKVETRNQRDELVQVMNAKIVVPRAEAGL